MVRRYAMFLTLTAVAALLAGAASAQSTTSHSDMRFGVGMSITRINDGVFGKTAMMPTAILDFEHANVEFGFNLRAGESETQFMLQVGGAYHPFELGGGQLGFGGQFNLETDTIVNNGNGQSGIMFGLYTEYRVPAGDFLDFGLRVFPFQLFHTTNYSRIGLFSPGLSAGFYF